MNDRGGAALVSGIGFELINVFCGRAAKTRLIYEQMQDTTPYI